MCHLFFDTEYHEVVDNSWHWVIDVRVELPLPDRRRPAVPTICLQMAALLLNHRYVVDDQEHWKAVKPFLKAATNVVILPRNQQNAMIDADDPSL